MNKFAPIFADESLNPEEVAEEYYGMLTMFPVAANQIDEFVLQVALHILLKSVDAEFPNYKERQGWVDALPHLYKSYYKSEDELDLTGKLIDRSGERNAQGKEKKDLN